jgi:hypothetical protein
MSRKTAAKLALLGVGILFMALLSGHTAAQGGGVKPIHLVTGDVTLPAITPEQVQVPTDALFDGYYFKLIQFKEIPTYEMRQQWVQQGLHLVDYLPDNTYFAVINQGFDLRELSGIATTVIDVADEVRLEPEFVAMQAQMGAQSAGDVWLTLTYYSPLDAQKVMADLQAHGATITAHRDYSSQLDINVPAALVDGVTALPYIQFVGPAFDETQVVLEEGPKPEDYYHNTTGRSNYLNSGFNGLNYNGNGVTIAVGEGGTADDYVDVHGRLTELSTGTVGHHKVGCLRNAAGGGNLDPTERNNAWGASVISCEGFPDYAALYNTYAMRFMNHSYGSGVGGGYCSMARDHDLRVQTHPYHLVSYSSGNVGDSNGYAPYDSIAGWANVTGCYKQNKNHFAIRNLDRKDTILSWGSKGPAYDGRILPQLIIEGEEGTSYASPKVVGIMAILAQAYKDKNGGQEAPSNLLRAILMNTADDLDDPGPDFRTGYGRPNVRRAYDVIDSGQFFSSTITNTNDINLHTIAVPSGVTQLRVMLMWPDKAAAVNADPAIVNDLDMIITDTVGTGYQPWVLDHTPDATKLDLPAVRKADHLNTMEQVTVDLPAAGNWTLQIKGHNVPEGPQTYYVVYEFLKDELKFMFPLKDVRMEQGKTYYLKWDSFGSVGTFDLDYQLDGGSWTSIATGVDANTRVYEWTAPALSGVHTIKFRVTRGAVSAESDINYIGTTPQGLKVLWACGDTVKLSWWPADGADGYYIYHLGAKYMEKVNSANITFDGTTALVSGIDPNARELFAVSAYTGSNEGLRTLSVEKTAGNYQCAYVKTTKPTQIGKTNLTLHGQANPHTTSLTNVHFEYGSDTSYGSTTSDTTITVTGHDDQVISQTINSTLSDRSDVLHYRLVGKSDGTDVTGEDMETRLAPGYHMNFDGADDAINLGTRFQILGNASRSITMWGYARDFSWNGLFQAGATGISAGDFAFSTTGAEDVWRMETWSWSNGTTDVTLPGSKDSWHFYAITYDGSGALKVYYDGQLMITKTGITLNTQSHDIYLGRHSDDMFDGMIDDASFWNVALTETQIRELMHHPVQGNESGLLAYYDFDGKTDVVFNVTDAITETLEGGVVKQSSSAPMGDGVTDLGTETAGVVNFANAGVSINYSSAGSASLAVARIDITPNATAGLPGGADIFDEQYWVIHRYGSGSFEADLTFSLAEDLTAADASNPEQVQLFARARGATDSWQFLGLADSVDAATDKATFTGITEFDKQFIIVRNTNPFIITTPDTVEYPSNTHAACAPLHYSLKGINLTNDVIVTAPPSFQVSTSAGSGFASSLTLTPSSGVVSETIYIKLMATAPGNYSGSVSNTSTGADSRTVTITPFTVRDQAEAASRAMKFDGSNDYLDIRDLDWNPNNQFTVEFWMNPSAFHNWNQRVGNGWGEFLFENNPGNSGVDAGVNNNHYIGVGNVFQTNEWQHFAFTLNGTNAKLFKNGEQIGTISNSDPLNSILSHFKIGNDGVNTIDGSLDEFRLWGAVRTQAEIRAAMHQRVASDATGLIAYLPFDNDDPANLTDYSAQCQTVSAYNAPVTEISTAPVGEEGKVVKTNSATTTGDSGKSLTVTITTPAQPDATNYLGIYRTGEGDGVVNSGETFPAGVTRRANIFWGIHEYGSVTATIVIDYSNVTGIDLSSIKLLKRSDAVSAWTDVTADFTHDAGAKTFTKTGATDFSEFTVADACALAATPTQTDIDLTGATETDVLLSWQNDAANTGGYEIHRSTAPYFTPDVSSLLATKPAGATQHTDSGAAGNASTNYFYIIRGKSSCGDISGFEKRLGEFDFTLIPGS